MSTCYSQGHSLLSQQIFPLWVLPGMQNLPVLCVAVAQRSFVRAQGLLLMVRLYELLRELAAETQA